MKQQGMDRLMRVLDGRSRPQPAVELEPASAYEAVTRQMVVSLDRDVRALRKRIDALIFMVLSAIAAEAASRLFGG
jgi:hypothetical protein